MLNEAAVPDAIDRENTPDEIETIASDPILNEQTRKEKFSFMLENILLDFDFNTLYALPEVPLKIEKTALILARMEEKEVDNPKSPYYYLGLALCSEIYEFEGIYALDSFIQKLDEREKPEFIERMYNRLQYSMHDNLEQEQELASNLLFKLNNTGRVNTIIRLLPEYIYSTEEKTSLLELTTENEWDRSKILRNIRFLTPELAKPLAVDVLNYRYSFDIDDYFRSNTFPRTNRKLERGNDSTEDFDNVVDKKIVNLYSAEDRELIALTLKNISSVIENGTTEQVGDTHLREALETCVKDLDATSKSFEIYNERLNKSREIPDFKDLLKDRIVNYYKTSLINRPDVNISNLNYDTLELLVDSLKLYNKVCSEICPILKEVTKEVDKEIFTNGAWFSGRDGIPMHLAVKASHWGQNLGERWAYKDVIQPQIDQNPKLKESLIELAKNERTSLGIEINENSDDELLLEGMDIYYAKDVKIHDLLKCASISRLLFENTMGDLGKDHLERVKTYLIDLGVTTNMLALDTGYAGSVIKNAIKYLHGDNDYLEEDILNRILLITSRTDTVRGIIPEIDRSDEGGKIERLPKKNQRTLAIEEGQPIFFPSKSDVQHLSWVVDHAIMRNFAPRRE